MIIFHVQNGFWKIVLEKNCAISNDLHIFPVKFTLADFLSLRKIIILYKLLFCYPFIQENTTGGKINNLNS